MNPRRYRKSTRLERWILLLGIVTVVGGVYGSQQQTPPAISVGSFTMGATATQAGIVFTDATGAAFGSRFSWYAKALQERINSNWRQSTIDPSLSSAPRVIARFDILRNGTITNLRITQSSNNYSVDESALKAVEESNPVMPLPPGYSGSRVGVEFYLDYKKQAPSQPHETSVMALPDCHGSPTVQPQRVTLTCADGNFSIENVSWTGWGASFAAGIGTGKINDCEPSCAAGHFHTYPMVLIATGKQTCPNNQPAYDKIVYTFVGRSGFSPDAPGTTDPTREFPCRTMQ